MILSPKSLVKIITMKMIITTKEILMNSYTQIAAKEYQKHTPWPYLAIILYGSQNYNLYNSTSDYDYKILSLPSFYAALTREKRKTYTYQYEYGQIVHQDLRDFIAQLRKGNPNALELLFSKDIEINPIFMGFWKILTDNRERIIRYNPIKFINALNGTAIASSTAKENPKRLSHALRSKYTLCQFLEGKENPFELSGERQTNCLMVKNNALSYEEFLTLFQSVKVPMNCDDLNEDILRKEFFEFSELEKDFYRAYYNSEYYLKNYESNS